MKNHLRIFFIVVLVSFTVMSASTGFTALEESRFIPMMELGRTGMIRGMVEFCGASHSGGIQVYIPGKSFLVKTGPSGEFVFTFVPAGSHNLVLDIPNQAPVTLNGVLVSRATTSDLGTIPFCPENYNDGYDFSLDCNDNNPVIFPGAEELCDGVDNNCDGIIDEECQTCTDADNDGFYAQDNCDSEVDCDDADQTINPSAEELCGDNQDNNCNGTIDEGCQADADMDGYPDDVDCDDTNPAINPGAMEVCDDDIDNNCNGAIDEDCPVDQDGDGYLFPGDDCDDTDNTIFPGADELCDNKDNDCDGVVDEGCAVDICAENPGICGPNALCQSSADNSYSCSCEAGYLDCNGDQIDGCEVSPTSDLNNCGSCGNVCGQDQTCSDGGCVCNFGFADCNGDQADGCEVELDSDPNNCGECGNICEEGLECWEGECV